MKELGEYLKTTRINNGVSLEEAADDMNLSVSELENIESGNERAFKDVYSLKQYIKIYAKYLGLDDNKVVDEFNGFLFERTSKISLDDIKEAQKKMEEDKSKKVISPYTKVYKEHFNIWPIVIGIAVIIILSIIMYLIISNINKAPVRENELSKVEGVEKYECTY